MHRFGVPSLDITGNPDDMTTGRTPGEAAQVDIDRALATILTVLRLLDEQWDTIDDHSRRATIRLALETARDQWRGAERARPSGT